MRLVVAGTPSAAVPSLEALLASRHEVVAVLTRPDAQEVFVDPPGVDRLHSGIGHGCTAVTNDALAGGDVVLIDSDAGTLQVQLDSASWAAREPQRPDLSGNRHGVGRELFGLMRANASSAEEGGSALFVEG